MKLKNTATMETEPMLSTANTAERLRMKEERRSSFTATSGLKELQFHEKGFWSTGSKGSGTRNNKRKESTDRITASMDTVFSCKITPNIGPTTVAKPTTPPSRPIFATRISESNQSPRQAKAIGTIKITPCNPMRE
jgi:hypothetical protein